MLQIIGQNEAFSPFCYNPLRRQAVKSARAVDFCQKPLMGFEKRTEI